MTFDELMERYEDHLALLAQIAERFAEDGPPSSWEDREDASPAEQREHDALYADWQRDPIGFLTPPPPTLPATAGDAYMHQRQARRTLAATFAERGDPVEWGPRYGLDGEAVQGLRVMYGDWQRDPAAFLTPPPPGTFTGQTGPM